MTLDEIRAYLEEEFPQVFGRRTITVEVAEGGEATLRFVPDAQYLRPGAIVSGPTMMMLADAAAYAALLSITDMAKMAVTSNFNVSFLRSVPLGSDVFQDARIIKQGKRLAVIVAEARDNGGRALTHATMTYAMPARPSVRASPAAS